MAAGRFRVFGDPSSKGSIRRTSESRKNNNNRVQFHGVEVREYARSLVDNPSTQDGPPLGLGWDYMNITLERNPIINETKNNYSPGAVIPIDDYENDAERRRRAKVMQLCKLREKSMRHILGLNAKKPGRRSRSKSLIDDEKDDSSSSAQTLTEEQMRQLSAHWLKIQPLTAGERKKIIFQHTDSTQEDIDEHQRIMRKLRRQRQASKASAESGLDDWSSMIEFIKRRFKRIKTGISKEREQELLWEHATEYCMNGGSVSSFSTSARSLRSSLSSVSHY